MPECPYYIRTVIRDEDRRYIIRGLTNKKMIKIVNIYAPDLELPKYIKTLVTKKLIDKTVIGDINTPLTATDR